VGSSQDEDATSGRVRAGSQAADCPASHFSKSVRSGAPPVISSQCSRTTRVILSTLKWPTRLRLKAPRRGTRSTATNSEAKRAKLTRRPQSPPLPLPPDQAQRDRQRVRRTISIPVYKRRAWCSIKSLLSYHSIQPVLLMIEPCACATT
jgi:hypothetical protein